MNMQGMTSSQHPWLPVLFTSDTVHTVTVGENVHVRRVLQETAVTAIALRNVSCKAQACSVVSLRAYNLTFTLTFAMARSHAVVHTNCPTVAGLLIARGKLRLDGGRSP